MFLSDAYTEPKNHVIQFIGLRHDFKDIKLAEKYLENALSTLLDGHEITIDSMTDKSTSWHSDNITNQADSSFCPENEIRQLLSQLKDSDGLPTRGLKSHMTELFTKPTGISVDWIGPCENLGRKRSEGSDVAPQQPSSANFSDSISTASPYESAEVSSQAGANLRPSSNESAPSPSSDSSSTSLNELPDGNSVTTTSSESSTTEPTRPTTTTPEPSSTPSLSNEVDEVNPAETSTTVASNILENISLSPFNLSDPFDFGSFSSLGLQELNNTELDDKFKTTPESTPATITLSTPDSVSPLRDMENFFKTKELIKTEAVTNETTVTQNSTVVEDSSLNSISSDSVLDKMTNKQDEVNLSLPNQTTTIQNTLATTTTQPSTTSLQETETNSSTSSSELQPQESLTSEKNGTNSRSGEEDGLHYGKYIGLTTAFLIFVAYLVCSLSYKRQAGQYDVQNASA